MSENENAFSKSIAGKLKSIVSAEVEALKIIDQAMREVGTRIQLLEEDIEKKRTLLQLLRESPLPPEEFGAFLADFIDGRAVRGEAELRNYLCLKLATKMDGPGHGYMSSPHKNLSFQDVEKLIAGARLGHDQKLGPFPINDAGGLSQNLMCFFFGDQIKAAMLRMLAERPITYSGGQPPMEKGMTERREQISAIEAELKPLEAELKEAVDCMARLRQKRLRQS